MSGPRRWPRIPAAQSSSPKARTASARTPGPARTNGTGSPEWMTSGEAGVEWSPVTQTMARSVGRSSELGVQLLDRPLLDARVLGVAGLVRRLQVDEDEGVAGFEPLVREREAAAQVGRVVGRLAARRSCRGRSAVARPRRNADSAMNVPCRPCRSGKDGTSFGRPHHLSVITFSFGRPRSSTRRVDGMLLEDLHRSARPRRRRRRRSAPPPARAAAGGKRGSGRGRRRPSR